MKKTGFSAEMIESSEQRSTNSFLFNLAMDVLLFTIFGMSLNTYMVIGFYIIFGIGCGIAFGNTMTIGNLRLPVQQKAYGNTSFNTLMQFTGAVGTSVCAALVSSAQSVDNSMNYAEKTAGGSTHSFIFLINTCSCMPCNSSYRIKNI